MRTIAIATALCLVTAASASARADGSTDQAAHLFRAGTDSYAHREFTEAARQFESAYRIAPRGAAIYDAGLAWEQAGEIARAADDFATAIGNPDTSSQQRSDATSRLKGLEARVARLVVTGPADAHVTVDDASAAGLPLGVHLVPGSHTLVIAYADGRTESRDVDARAGAEVVVRLSAPADAPTQDQPTEALPPKETPAATTSDGGASTRRTLAWVSLGAAGVASVIAIIFYAQGVNALHSFEKDGETQPFQNLQQQAITDRTVTQVLVGVAGAFVATSVVLYITSSGSAPSKSTTSTSTSLRVGPTGAALRVTF